MGRGALQVSPIVHAGVYRLGHPQGRLGLMLDGSYIVRQARRLGRRSLGHNQCRPPAREVTELHTVRRWEPSGVQQYRCRAASGQISAGAVRCGARLAPSFTAPPTLVETVASGVRRGADEIATVWYDTRSGAWQISTCKSEMMSCHQTSGVGIRRTEM